ncbi:HPr family phosphocarrier protein [Bacillus sp. IB182487]|uniref:Phosphocarrier protein HPr n=1 Tax=Metabacillus arenae TaxID=2771434 RepID=A0A926RYS8_9BACI|nr:HPr family phosphocarrier protein [Metabacillus arenae]
MVQKTLIVTDKTGIHARPATALVNKAGIFDSDVTIEYN